MRLPYACPEAGDGVSALRDFNRWHHNPDLLFGMQPQYHGMILLPEHEPTPIQEINEHLKACLEAAKADRVALNDWPGYADPTRTDDIFTAYWGNWPLHLCLSTGKWIAEELQELAANHNHQPPFDRVAKCTKRIELWSDDDPNMDHFNDYVCVLNAIGNAFPGAIVFDSGEVV